MRRVIKPWLQLFRVPNLPTAVGDAVAGGATVAFAVGRSSEEIPGSVVAAALAAGAAELLLYLGGLADNDLVDEEADRAQKHAVRSQASVYGLLRKRHSELIQSAAAGKIGIEFKAVRNCFYDFCRSSAYFRADAVARNQCNSVFI